MTAGGTARAAVRQWGMTKTLLPLALAAMLAACSGSPVDDNTLGNQEERNLGLEPTDAEIIAGSSDNRAEVAASANTLTVAGLGDIVIGREVPPGLTEYVPRVSDDCRMFQDKARPGLNVITDGEGVVQTVSVQSPSTIATDKGITPRAAVAALTAAYPGMRVEPDDYGNTNHYTARADRVGLRFSVGGDGRVGEIFAGRQPFLSYAEGCA
jgi:hypothetical protein